VISRPTTQQLIEAICIELADKVAPTLTDPVIQIQLEMALSVLQTAAARSGSELAWMQEERDAIEETARQLLEALPDAEPLQAALQAYADGLTNSLYLEEAQEDYARASEVLSRAIEAAYESGDADHIAAVGRLMDQRHANQQSVTGQFMAAGRA
jgi:tetratricopeptide (TPR) repeat protein